MEGGYQHRPMLMGQRGPQPQPARLKLLNGNPGKRPINLADGVNPEVAVPDAPSHLIKEARKEWRRITVELVALGLISRLDRAELAMYCQNWGKLVLLEDALARRMTAAAEAGDDPLIGMVDVAQSGYRMKNVEVTLIDQFEEKCHKFLQSFGLSPASRSRVTPSTNQMILPGMEATPTGWERFAKK